MDTPNMLRGHLYSTHTFARCPSFKPCVLCKMCANYTRHTAQCQLCESRKRPKQICTCTPTNRDSTHKIQEAIGGALFDPDRASGGVVSMTDEDQVRHWDSLVDNLNLSGGEQ